MFKPWMCVLLYYSSICLSVYVYDSACSRSIAGSGRAFLGYPITAHHSYAFLTAWVGWRQGGSHTNKQMNEMVGKKRRRKLCVFPAGGNASCLAKECCNRDVFTAFDQRLLPPASPRTRLLPRCISYPWRVCSKQPTRWGTRRS